MNRRDSRSSAVRATTFSAAPLAVPLAATQNAGLAPEERSVRLTLSHFEPEPSTQVTCRSYAMLIILKKLHGPRIVRSRTSIEPFCYGAFS